MMRLLTSHSFLSSFLKDVSRNKHRSPVNRLKGGSRSLATKDTQSDDALDFSRKNSLKEAGVPSNYVRKNGLCSYSCSRD